MSRAAHADDRRARTGWRLFIVGLGIGQICSWGSLYYSFPMIAEAMGSDPSDRRHSYCRNRDGRSC
jgi:hypothetical protein